MSQFIEGPRKTFTAGEALQPFRRVKVTAVTGAYGPTVSYADASDPAIGITEVYTPSGSPVTIYLANAQGTRKMVATAVAITGGNPVYAAADGTVAAAGSVVEGTALETTAGDAGDILEVLPVVSVDLVAAGGITLPSVTFNGLTGANKLIMTDNLADALNVVEAANSYLKFTTTNGAEAVTIGKAAVLASTLSVTGVASLPGNVANTAGVGITGTAAAFVTSVERIGTMIKTTILIDLTDLNSGGTAADIIGANGAGVAHLGQITTAVNGTIVAGKITCLETPTGGDPDIDLWYADEATGVEDTGIAALTGETQVINHGDWSGGEEGNLTAPIAANKYMYLTTGDATDAAYTAGILLIELWGK